MQTKVNPIGQKFHRLTVKEKVKRENRHGFLWVCECECGGSTKTTLRSLKSGHTKSCGCLKIEKATQRFFDHGESRSSEYSTWSGMKSRCHCPTSDVFHHYGGRGIKVCSAWRDSFETFLRDMGRRPSPKHSLERIDNDGDYEPGNVRWATRTEQGQNTRRTKWIEYRGKTRKLQDWASILNVPHSTLYARIFENGWSVERAFGTPARKLFEFNGMKKTLTTWTRELYLPYGTIYKKVVYEGQDFSKVISKALKKRIAA